MFHGESELFLRAPRLAQEAVEIAEKMRLCLFRARKGSKFPHDFGTSSIWLGLLLFRGEVIRQIEFEHAFLNFGAHVFDQGFDGAAANLDR